MIEPGAGSAHAASISAPEQPVRKVTGVPGHGFALVCALGLGLGFGLGLELSRRVGADQQSSAGSY